MKERYVFDYVGDKWTWRCINEKKTVIRQSKENFTYYLECLKSAKSDGLVGDPLFQNADGEFSAANHLQL